MEYWSDGFYGSPQKNYDVNELQDSKTLGIGDKMNDSKSIRPINNLDYLEELLNEGYSIKGPRSSKSPEADPKRDLVSFKAFLKRGKEFASEDWLSSMGYKFVEPNTFTRGRRIAYKIIDEFPDERFKSSYSLLKGEMEIPLYLEVELPELDRR